MYILTETDVDNMQLCCYVFTLIYDYKSMRQILENKVFCLCLYHYLLFMFQSIVVFFSGCQQIPKRGVDPIGYASSHTFVFLWQCYKFLCHICTLYTSRVLLGKHMIVLVSARVGNQLVMYSITPEYYDIEKCDEKRSGARRPGSVEYVIHSPYVYMT